jgi:GntP family gluconate:H+ symporter
MSYILSCTIFKPQWAPALPPEARVFREPSGKMGGTSLAILTLISVGVAVGYAQFVMPADKPLDEVIVICMLIGIGVAFALAVISRALKLNLLSAMAQKVTFVLIPPLALIFLVLGTIFLGIATPTEGGAMGASGAIIMALMRRRLSWSLLKQAMDSTAKLTTFVVFILVGARVFSLTFYGVDGHKWVEHLLSDLPGGEVGFLIVVNILVFVLAFFLDFFELSFIIVPLLGPVAEKLGIDLIWFGVLLAVNMQTSFMHPPFGFALFYLRSVAPSQPYRDAHDGRMLAPVTTGQIYWGAIPFVIIQCIMVALIIAFPALVSYDKPVSGDGGGPQIDIQQMLQEDASKSGGAFGGDTAAPQEQQDQQADDALMKSLGEPPKDGAAPAGSPAPEPGKEAAAPPAK